MAVTRDGAGTFNRLLAFVPKGRERVATGEVSRRAANGTRGKLRRTKPTRQGRK
jgi:hypothetical protein